MSRQNKVNPGMYTQRGRLTQDDAARELRKQREVGSRHTWQPVQKDQLPEIEPQDEDSDEVMETSGDASRVDTKPATAGGQPFKQLINKPKPSPKAGAKAARPKAAKSGAAGRTGAKTKTRRAKTVKGSARKTSKRGTKAKATAAKRQAVLARNVGGNPKPRSVARRRKS